MRRNKMKYHEGVTMHGCCCLGVQRWKLPSSSVSSVTCPCLWVKMLASSARQWPCPHPKSLGQFFIFLMAWCISGRGREGGIKRMNWCVSLIVGGLHVSASKTAVQKVEAQPFQNWLTIWLWNSFFLNQCQHDTCNDFGETGKKLLLFKFFLNWMFCQKWFESLLAFHDRPAAC